MSDTSMLVVRNARQGRVLLKHPAPLCKKLEQRIATDTLGELPLTDKGAKYILVVSDYFTKWTEAFPMPNMEAITVADINVREEVSRTGVLSIIYSDQGKQYESQFFSEMCQVLHI